MRLLYILTFCLLSTLAYADDSNDFPPPPTSTMPGSISPQGNLAGTGSTPTTTTSGSDTFGALVQQNTSQAMQVFQNVNYQKLSGAENQGDFGSDSDSGNASSSSGNTTLPFKIYQESQ